MEIMICIIQRDGAVRPRVLPLMVDETGIEIGRALSCDLCLEDPERAISHRHARIHESGGQLWVTDLSRNGTLLNGAPLPSQQPVVLRDKDWLSIGPYELRVILDTGAAAGEPAQAPLQPQSIPEPMTQAATVPLAMQSEQTQVLAEARTAVVGEVAQRLKDVGQTQPIATTPPGEAHTRWLHTPVDLPDPGNRTGVLTERTQVLSRSPAAPATQILSQRPTPEPTRVLVPAPDGHADLIETVLAILSERFDPAGIEQRLLGHPGPAFSDQERARCWEGFKAAYPGLLIEIRAALDEQKKRRGGILEPD